MNHLRFRCWPDALWAYVWIVGTEETALCWPFSIHHLPDPSRRCSQCWDYYAIPLPGRCRCCRSTVYCRRMVCRLFQSCWARPCFVRFEWDYAYWTHSRSNSWWFHDAKVGSICTLRTWLEDILLITCVVILDGAGLLGWQWSLQALEE